MAGVAILTRVAFSEAGSFIGELASRLEGVLVESKDPVRVGPTWAVFRPTPRAECSAVVMRHWEGRSFPIAESHPEVTFAIVLEDNILEIDPGILEAVSSALGDPHVSQALVHP